MRDCECGTEKKERKQKNNDTDVSGNLQRGNKFGVTINAVQSGEFVNESYAHKLFCMWSASMCGVHALNVVGAGDVYIIQLFYLIY